MAKTELVDRAFTEKDLAKYLDGLPMPSDADKPQNGEARKRPAATPAPKRSKPTPAPAATPAAKSKTSSAPKSSNQKAAPR